MKKNKILRLASVMLMLCLITTCAISGTFAKYTTSGTGSDTARVAKWGVTVDLSATDLFNTTYNDGKVATTTSNNIVAPGTTGTLANITISGTPEVATTVTVAGTLTLTGWSFEADWDNNSETPATTVEYCPIVFTINGVTYGTNDTAATNKSATVAELKSAVETAIAALSGSFAANATLDASALNSKISWAWVNNEANNVKDTVLGNQAANATAPSVTLALTVTVDQTI